ncbi:hypothetical protein [Flavobacterium sp.]|uniref:hypothetical protein n=1 Tax=Flavobacterium sp. TaxID=239 RepID=UPI00286E698D|nr:hypothetical protein [Flavobacterium sp.]
MKKQFKIFLLSFLIPFFGLANDEEFGFSKQKNIKKAYFVNTDAGISIDNSYGNIFVTTWDEDKIEIDVLIKVSGNSEKWVNKRIDDINVEIQALKNLVSAKTIIAQSDFYNNGNTNSFEINYTIKIPKNGSVNLNNKYGDIITGNLTNNSNILCKYGKITLGRLNGSNTSIELGYCPNSTVEYIKNGTIDARYSGLKINEVTKLFLDSNYTDVYIGEGQNISYDSNYGKLKFGKVNSLNASGNYLTIHIAEIFNTLKLETNYSQISIDTINEKANNATIDIGYSNITIGYSPNYDFDFDVSTKYGEFKHGNDLEINNKEEIKNAKQINGFHGKKGVNKLIINSRYGNINLIKNKN